MGERVSSGGTRSGWWHALIALCIMAACVGAAACGDDTGSGNSDGGDSADSKKPITIGAAVASSGWLEPYDGPALTMAQFAAEDINENGGVLGRELKVVSADSKSDQAAGSTAALEVIDQGADMVMVSCDFDFGSPAALVAQENDKIAFSSCAGSPKFGVQGIGPNAYTMSNGTPALGAIMAEFAYDSKKLRNAYILLDDTIEYTKTLCAYFEEAWTGLGGKIAGKDTYKNDDPSVRSQITRLQGTPSADFIFQCSYNPGGAKVLRQLRNAGIDLPVLASESQDGNYWLSAVPDLSDFYYQTYGSVFGDDPRDKVNELVQRYEDEVGEQPAQALGLTGYSVVEAYAKAIEEAGSTDTAAVRKALDSFQDVELLVGPTSFSPDLHINLERSQVIMEIQDGKNQYLETRTPEQIPEVKF